MNISRCPACGKTAMKMWSKYARNRLVCGNCHIKLKLSSTPTLSLAIAVFAASVLAIKTIGFNSTTFLIIIGCLIVFALCGFFIPLEVRNKD